MTEADNIKVYTMQKKLLNSLRGATLFAILFVGIASANAQTQEPKKVVDTTFVNAMRNPKNWKLYRVEQAPQIKFGPKPKNPPIYKKQEDGWIEIPADSIHQPIPSPIVDKKINGVSR